MATSEREVGRDWGSVSSTTRIPRFARPWERTGYQRIWLRVATSEWRTLAVVPAEDGMPTHDVANLIMTLGVFHGESIGVLDFRYVRVNRALDAIRTAESQLEPGERLIFATRSIRENLATIPLARATDGVILCVSLGSTSMRLATETIEQIGKERFLGSIVVRVESDDASARKVTPSQRRLEERC